MGMHSCLKLQIEQDRVEERIPKNPIAKYVSLLVITEIGILVI